jgi:serine/threonine-protein kinase HipA
MVTKNQLSVLLNGKITGVLEQTLNGKMRFTYDNTANQAISLSMPIREAAYEAAKCEAFFGGLLPESDATRRAIGAKYGISPNNIFALLKAIGYDCAGAISFYSANEPPILQRSFPLTGKIISDDALYKLIVELPKKPLFGERLSLAGVQDKAAVCIIDNQIALPENNCPTTYILKPAVQLEGLIENEYICLSLASEIGLTVPKIEIRHVKNIPYLLIERYDRNLKNNQVERIHQEDFCQALSIPVTHKYQNEGGPSFKQCFDLLKNTTRPANNVNNFATAMVFNYLTGNMDAHGKNFSLLHKDSSQISLTPSYDIVCTRVYPDLTAKMAMKIGSQYEADKVLPRHWEKLCNEIDYSFLRLKGMITKQGEMILKAIETNREFYIEVTRNKRMVDRITTFLEKHIPKVTQQFD